MSEKKQHDHLKKECLFCGTAIFASYASEFARKRFCSHSCRQKFRYKNGEFTWFEKFKVEGHNPIYNEAKSLKLSQHPCWIVDRNKLKHKPRPELKEFREKVIKRDGKKCAICFSENKKVIIDHIKSYSLFPHLRFDPNNGRILCEKCHRKTDNYGVKSTKRYAKIAQIVDLLFADFTEKRGEKAFLAKKYSLSPSTVGRILNKKAIYV